MSAEISRWARPDHTPCPTHGLTYLDEAGMCLPSCGFGWARDPLLIVRDELARHLYVHEPYGPDVALTAAEQNAGAQEWDAGLVTDDDVQDCYARADKLLAEQETTR